MCLLGCGLRSPSDLPPVAKDIIGTRCAEEELLVGLLIADPKLGLVIRDDQGVMTPLLLRMRHSIRWSPDPLAFDQIEVVDGDGNVLATTGRRYKIGGQIAEWAGNRFWACADVWSTQ
jgi:hypothetical protein